MSSRSIISKVLSTSAAIAPVLFGCVFLVSGTAKIFSFDSFVATIHQFGISEPIDTVLAVAIIALELAVGICIVINRFRSEAIVTAMILLAAFMSVITINLSAITGTNC